MMSIPLQSTVAMSNERPAQACFACAVLVLVLLLLRAPAMRAANTPCSPDSFTSTLGP
jgi:hypothetical protein